MSEAVATWLAQQEPVTRATVDAIRAAIIEASPTLVEEFKWNAPSFRDGADHKVTLGVDRRGGIRIVLHRGVAVRDAAGFAFDDPDALARWASRDRGVVFFADAAAVRARRPQLVSLLRRWIAATR